MLYSTGFAIRPSEWSFRMQRPIEKERRPDLWAIRRQLDDLDAQCRAIYIESEYGRIGVRDFKKKLDLAIGRCEPEKEKPPLTFFRFVEQELKEMRPQDAGILLRRLHTPRRYSAGFAREKGSFSFDDVDWNFRLRLIDWLTARGVQLGYGNKTLSILRQFMERARRKKLHANTKYQGSGWLVPQKKALSAPVSLNPAELQALADLKLTGYLKKVLDLFLIGAGTGSVSATTPAIRPIIFTAPRTGCPSCRSSPRKRTFRPQSRSIFFPGCCRYSKRTITPRRQSPTRNLMPG
ncbi:MAG: phage integrase SAM-like domain-containing protein [Lewinellaceae bacterium]|nr:phage integrase SAM-like domain-containing protein [Lewinellaceae bacterium]